MIIVVHVVVVKFVVLVHDMMVVLHDDGDDSA